jgi:hypothetical protein
VIATAAWPGRTPLARLVCIFTSALALAVGCATATHRDQASTGPVAYPLPAPISPHPSLNWSVLPEQAETVMSSGKLEIRGDQAAGAGVTGAHKLTIDFPELGKELVVKWKEAPQGLESWNNSPRRELAAYAVQKLFLDAEDYVVPPSVMRCLPLDDYRAAIDASHSPTLPGSTCVLGNLSLWLENVTVPDVLYDEARFATDANYAARMADFNLLTFIIDHKDGRRGNFVVSKDEGDRRVFSIDNGISFDAWIFNYFVKNWNDLRVPALRKKSVDRLRSVRQEQVEALAVVAELHRNGYGVLEPVEHGPPLSETNGARQREGVVQLGLIADEVDDVFEQIDEVIRAVDGGELPVF